MAIVETAILGKQTHFSSIVFHCRWGTLEIFFWGIGDVEEEHSVQVYVIFFCCQSNAEFPLIEGVTECLKLFFTHWKTAHGLNILPLQQVCDDFTYLVAFNSFPPPLWFDLFHETFLTILWLSSTVIILCESRSTLSCYGFRRGPNLTHRNIFGMDFFMYGSISFNRSFVAYLTFMVCLSILTYLLL